MGVEDQRLSEETVKSLCVEQDEPVWLRNVRLNAWTAFKELPAPTTRDEEWRRTDISGLRWDELALARTVANGTRSAYAAENGVLLLDLATAAREHSDLVKEHLGRAVPAAAGKFEALSAALWCGGTLLYVPPRIKVDVPIRLINHGGGEGSLFPRTLVIADESSEVTIIEEFTSSDGTGAEPGVTDRISCGAVELFVKDGAAVRYVSAQNYGNNVWDFTAKHGMVGKDARLDWLVATMGSALTKSRVDTSMIGEGAETNMLGMFFGDGSQHVDHQTNQNHVVPHCRSDLLFKGVLKDRACGIYRGTIRVHKEAQRSDAYQACRNLLLNRGAKAHPIPMLEIEANDVRCTHGATIGRVDDEQLYYAMTRGLSKYEAQQLIVHGFFEELGARFMRDVAGGDELGAVWDEMQIGVEAKLA